MTADASVQTPPLPARAPALFRVALVGNPNAGKTSLFNALTGYRRHVANFPGVTVESARGRVRRTRAAVELIDLPGTYSLAAASPDEMVVCDVLSGRMQGETAPDAILAVVDATNLSRHLYLISQLLETDLPIVVAANMVDVATARGLEFDFQKLSQRLGVPVVPIVATSPPTIAPLLAEVERLAAGHREMSAQASRAKLPDALVAEIDGLRRLAAPKVNGAEAIRILLDRDGAAADEYASRGGSEETIAAARQRLATAGIAGPASEVRARYAWIAEVLQGVIRRPDRPVVTLSDRIDRVLTHKLWGAVALILVLFVVFQAIFSWAAPIMDAIDAAFAWLSGAAARVIPDGAVQSFVCNGLIAGVGGVLIFLPQILILFGFIAILEDCGYLARAAHMVDRLMRGLGLSGRAFIPLLSSFACAVPAIMGTRTISDRRERFITIFLAPFMSCSARLPVYFLMITAFVPPASYLGGWVTRHALVLLAMYLVGVVVAVPLAWILRKALFAGPASGFMLEMPSYKWPRWQAVLDRMWTAGKKFVVGAGTVIVLVNLLVWTLGYFPRSESVRTAVEARGTAAGWTDERVEQELAGEYLRESFLGQMGHAIEPVVRPLGWDWRIGVAVIASLPAREVVVATMGTIYNLGEDTDEESESLREAIRSATWPQAAVGKWEGEKVGTESFPAAPPAGAAVGAPGTPVFTLPVALSIMVFFALCAQCTSTLVVIGRETRSWRWPIASFVTMTGIAYLAAWGTAAGAQAMGW